MASKIIFLLNKMGLRLSPCSLLSEQLEFDVFSMILFNITVGAVAAMLVPDFLLQV
jgi:hypothetical protein